MLRFLESIRLRAPLLFRRFTDQSVNAAGRCQEARGRAARHDITPEHVLLGVATLRGGAQARVILGNLGLDLERDTMVVTALANAHEPGQSQAAPTLAPETQRLLNRAREHARGLGHNYVGTEHLILGLPGGTGQAADYLRERGITRIASLPNYRSSSPAAVSGPTPRSPGMPLCLCGEILFA